MSMSKRISHQEFLRRTAHAPWEPLPDFLLPGVEGQEVEEKPLAKATPKKPAAKDPPPIKEADVAIQLGPLYEDN